MTDTVPPITPITAPTATTTGANGNTYHATYHAERHVGSIRKQLERARRCAQFVLPGLIKDLRPNVEFVIADARRSGRGRIDSSKPVRQGIILDKFVY
jgi:hypothetical protein